MTTSVRQTTSAILLVVLQLATAPCVAQKDLERRIDAYIKLEMQRQQIPGVSLAMVRNGKIAILKSYG
jgi:CubicO group peptidase (beta-lactamase class C family)